MSELPQRFTTNQTEKLQHVGIHSLYDFITYLPKSLSKIQPLESYWVQEGQFLWQAKLLNVTFRKGRQTFLLLETQGKFRLQAYFFGFAQYTVAALKPGQKYQFLISYKNKFWTVQKFAPLKSDDLTDEGFILGRAHLKDYLVPKYGTLNGLQNGYFIQLHRRLQPADYLLDLQGLVPASDLIPQQLDLSAVHRPQSMESFQQAQRQWTAFKVYLRLCLMRYLDNLSRQNYAPGTKLDVEFLKQMTARLPFELSQTQKLAVWEILNELKILLAN